MGFQVSTSGNYAVQSMSVQQKAMSVVAENLANANNPDYSAKSLKIVSDASGIRALAPQSIQDPIRTEDVRLQNIGLGYLETIKTAYELIMRQFGQPADDTALGTRLTKIQTHLGKLQENPNDEGLQRDALNSFQSTLKAIKDLSHSVQDARRTAESGIQDAIGNVKSILQTLGDINGTLSAASNRGDQVSSLVDQQNVLLRDLSSYLDVAIYRREDGSIDLTTNSGQALLLRTGVKDLTFSTSTSIAPGDTAVTLNKITVDGHDIGPSISNGKIAAFLKVRDAIMPSIQAQLDEFCEKFRDTFNAVHNKGTALPPQRTLTGTQAFTTPATTTLSMTGQVRIGVLNQDGTLAAVPLDFDFTGGPHTINAVVTALNTSLATAGLGTATLDANGHLVLQATNGTHGLSLISLGAQESVDQTTGKGFSHFFGLNDLFVSGPDKIGLTLSLDIREDMKAKASLLSRASLDTNALVAGDVAMRTGSHNIVDELMDEFEGNLSFTTAGTLSGRTTSLVGYANAIWHENAVNAKNSVNDYESDLRIFEESIKDLRSRTGVNMSEEIVTLLEAQKIYAASTKCLQANKECFDQLMRI